MHVRNGSYVCNRVVVLREAVVSIGAAMKNRVYDNKLAGRRNEAARDRAIWDGMQSAKGYARSVRMYTRV